MIGYCYSHCSWCGQSCTPAYWKNYYKAIRVFIRNSVTSEKYPQVMSLEWPLVRSEEYKFEREKKSPVVALQPSVVHPSTLLKVKMSILILFLTVHFRSVL